MAVVSIFHAKSAPTHTGSPAGMTASVRAAYHSCSVMAACRLRVGRLHTKRRQWLSVQVGAPRLSRSTARVTAFSGLAALTTLMSSVFAPSGTAHSWSTRRSVAARTKAPRRVTLVASERMRARVSSNSAPGSPEVLMVTIWPSRLASLPAHVR